MTTSAPGARNGSVICGPKHFIAGARPTRAPVPTPVVIEKVDAYIAVERTVTLGSCPGSAVNIVQVRNLCCVKPL